jgi:hypothetical protein
MLSSVNTEYRYCNPLVTTGNIERPMAMLNTEVTSFQFFGSKLQQAAPLSE